MYGKKVKNNSHEAIFSSMYSDLWSFSEYYLLDNFFEISHEYNTLFFR